MKTAEFFMFMGPFKVPMIIVALLVIAIIIKKSFDIFIRYKNPELNVKKHLDSILFWGKFALILGILGQIIGIYSAVDKIIHAKDINPQIIMIGFKGSFNSTIFGFFILILALLSWYLLKLRADKIS